MQPLGTSVKNKLGAVEYPGGAELACGTRFGYAAASDSSSAEMPLAVCMMDGKVVLAEREGIAAGSAIVFYASASSGGSADVLHTVTISNGAVSSWVKGGVTQTGTFTFYLAADNGGSMETLNTVTLADGRIVSWDQG